LVSFFLPQYLVWDASIAHRYIGEPTIPEWVPFAVPVAMLVATLVVGELVLSRLQHRSLTDAIAVILYFILDALQVKR
jgi:hypothetical protein